MAQETQLDVTKALPSLPGVYEIRDTRLGVPEQVQLDNLGYWWPYPYMFSGWRPGELRVMGGTWYRLDDVESDVPEIRNPHRAEEIDYFAEELASAFPEISHDRLVAFARAHVLDEDDLVG